MLDEFTLQVVFALTALVSCALFITSYVATGSRYSLYWIFVLLFLMAGAASYLLEGTPLQAVGLPVGDGLSAIGLSFSWAAARALRQRRLKPWFFVVPAAVTTAATALGDPGTDTSAGAGVRYATFAVILVLAAREVWLVDSRFSRVRWSLFAVSAGLGGYYLFRLVVRLIGPAVGDGLEAAAGPTAAVLVTEMALITVSFGVIAISHAEKEFRLNSVATRAARELVEGVQVQRALFPAQRPRGVQFPVAGACVPSRSLSGDFFDWTADADRLVVTLGDVMGKGVGAAMLGATVRAGLKVARRRDPGADVAAIADALGEDLVRNGSFVTLFHAYLDRATNRLTVLDAGHGLGMIVRRGGEREQIRSVNLPLGLNRDNGWIVRTYILEPGDRLLVFSDGVLDLFDGTIDSLDQAADVALGREVRNMDEAVDRIRELADSGSHDDDVTVVALERPLVAATRVDRR